MSRIDEALQRISNRPRHDSSSQIEAIQSQDSVLETYPADRRSAVHLTSTARKAIVHAPRTGESRLLTRIGSALEGKLVASEEVPRGSIEQYRHLAAVLHELQMERGIKTVMVTSALPREGKTLTVTNLALTLSESYKRKVLLIDADLRRPTVHELFQLPDTHGLSETLRNSDRQIALIEVSKYLTVLPGGRPDVNPMAGLTSERMHRLIEEAGEEFEWLLIDTPPVGLMPDAHHMARFADGALFVIAAGSTPYQMVQRAVNELGRERILGTVLNRVAPVAMPESDYYKDYAIESTPSRTSKSF